MDQKADLVVLDKNLLATDTYTFSSVKVVNILMDGKVVFNSEQVAD